MGETDHKIVLGRRLRQELARKGVTTGTVASTAGVEEAVVSAYLRGERPVNFAELTPICRAMNADPMRLLSPAPDYSQPQLSYRNSSPAARSAAAAVENAFLLVRQWLPVPLRPRCHKPQLHDGSPAMLMAETRRAVEALRAEYRTVEELFNAHQLPVLALGAGPSAFDAFLLHYGKHFLVCVNKHKPNARIEFSLLHEFAHFAFDADHDVPLDENIIFTSDLYGDEVSEHARREYVANKFSQLWLVPFEDAEMLARDLKRGGDYVRERQVSPDVVANAIRDVLIFAGRSVSIMDIRKDVLPANGYWQGRSEIRGWLDKKNQAFAELIAGPLEDEFGEDRRMQVKKAMGIGDV